MLIRKYQNSKQVQFLSRLPAMSYCPKRLPLCGGVWGKKQFLPKESGQEHLISKVTNLS